MQKKVVFGILAALVLAAGAIFVVAQKGRQSGGGGHGFGPGGGQMMGLRGLDLTDEQQAAVKGIMETSRTAVEPLHQQMADNQAKLKALGTDGTFDEAQAQALAAEHGGIMANMVLERVKTKAQVFALLTEEQRAKAASMPDKFGKGRGHRKGGNKQPRGETF